MELILFIDSEEQSPVNFVGYSLYRVGFEGEMLCTLIADGSVLFYSDKGKGHLKIWSSSSGCGFSKLLDVCFSFTWK